MNKNLFISIVIITISCTTKDNNFTSDISKIDSTSYYIKKARNNAISLNLKKTYLKKAYQFNAKETNDSLLNKRLLSIAFEAYNLKDTLFFKKTNKKALLLSRKLMDSFGIGDASWNYGSFYSDNKSQDSSYYYYNEAYKAFNSISRKLYKGKMLFNMALVEGEIKDYIASEVLVYRAISIFKDIDNNYLSLYRCYNHLGVLQKELKQYNKALKSYEIANDYLTNAKNKRTYTEGLKNNIGIVYQKQGDYKKAISFFSKALETDSLKYKNTALYARLLDNLAYTKLLNADTVKLKSIFFKSLKIRDGLNNKEGVVISKLHLSEFFVFKKDTINALRYADEAYRLATKIQNHRDRLASLQFLSKLNSKKSHHYFSKYIQINDSLQEKERTVREKFTKIRFQTNEIVKEKEALVYQKYIILASGGILLLILFLIYYAKQQVAKAKYLWLDREQKKANEEVYSLMLKEHNKLEEGRLQERNRIAEELHDGVLGKLFGTRIGFGYLPVEGNTEIKEKYNVLIDEIQDIEGEIRTISHELKNEIFNSKKDFYSVLDYYIQNQCRLDGINYKFINDPDLSWNSIDSKVKMNIYRIIQEGLQNIFKHAKANHITINMYLKPNRFNMVIADDGQGFDKKLKKKRIGIENIESRISKLGGTFKIETAINKGTKLFVEIPI